MMKKGKWEPKREMVALSPFKLNFKKGNTFQTSINIFLFFYSSLSQTKTYILFSITTYYKRL